MNHRLAAAIGLTIAGCSCVPVLTGCGGASASSAIDIPFLLAVELPSEAWNTAGLIETRSQNAQGPGGPIAQSNIPARVGDFRSMLDDFPAIAGVFIAANTFAPRDRGADSLGRSPLSWNFASNDVDFVIELAPRSLSEFDYVIFADGLFLGQQYSGERVLDGTLSRVSKQGVNCWNQSFRYYLPGAATPDSRGRTCVCDDGTREALVVRPIGGEEFFAFFIFDSQGTDMLFGKGEDELTGDVYMDLTVSSNGQTGDALIYCPQDGNQLASFNYMAAGTTAQGNAFPGSTCSQSIAETSPFSW